MGNKKRKRYVADFETTTDPTDCRVWASCLVDIETFETAFLSNNIEDFFKFLENKNTVVYFHNLRFDGEFILHYLLTHGYTYSDKNLPGTFSTLITDDGVFYSITVIFDKKEKNYKKVVFYDSLKKLPFKVAVIAKAFNLPDLKGEIDYNMFRPVGYELTEEEKDYIVKDCKIVAQALHIQMIDNGLVKMTNASDAMSHYKETIGKRTFEALFPVFPLHMDDDIRLCYKGGFTRLQPQYENVRGLQGITLDVNSLYPWVMYECLLPCRYPVFFEGKYKEDENFPLYIQHMRCCFKLKPGHIPTLQLKNNRRFIQTEYLTSSKDATGTDEPVELHLTSVDLKLFLDHYDIDEETYINGWKFRGERGIFKDYIDYWMHIKENTTGAQRQLAKLQLNSLYGRFALNPYGKIRVSELEEGIVKHKIVNKEIVKEYDLKEPEPRDPVYTALACFVTAYARDKTIRSAQSVYDRFIYADTDSLHLIGFDVPEGLEIHPTKLGAWKHEGNFIDSKYIRAKTYMETMLQEDGSTKTLVTCAGMPDNVKKLVNYDNFKPGSVFPGKLVPRRCPGGVVLTETTFTLK